MGQLDGILCLAPTVAENGQFHSARLCSANNEARRDDGMHLLFTVMEILLGLSAIFFVAGVIYTFKLKND